MDTLIIKCGEEQLEIIEYVIEYGDSEYTLDYDNDRLEISGKISALCKKVLNFSIENGFLDMIILLKENGILINNDYDYILKKSVSYGHLNIVEYLINSGVNIKKNAYDLLNHAVYNGHLDIVLILTKYASVHLLHRTIFYNVIRKGDVKMIKLLLDLGLNIHDIGSISLSEAVGCNNLEMVKILIMYGAKVNYDKDLALRLSVERNYLDITTFLLQCNANLHINHDYVLLISAQKGYLDMVKLLIDSGSNINAQNDRALYNSLTTKNDDVTNYLLTFYSNDDMKKFIDNKELGSKLLKHVLRNTTKNEKLICLYREIGIDIFDMIEKEN